MPTRAIRVPRCKLSQSKLASGLAADAGYERELTFPRGMAPIAHVLFNKFMRFNPKNPKWLNRDRFVLS